MKNLTIDYYANNFTATALEQMLHFADREMDNPEVRREVPKIKEALHVMKAFENLEELHKNGATSWDCPRCGNDPEDCWCEGPEEGK